MVSSISRRKKSFSFDMNQKNQRLISEKRMSTRQKKNYSPRKSTTNELKRLDTCESKDKGMLESLKTIEIAPEISKNNTNINSTVLSHQSKLETT